MLWVLNMKEDKKKEWKENLKSAYATTDSLNKDIKTLMEIIIYILRLVNHLLPKGRRLYELFRK